MPDLSREQFDSIEFDAAASGDHLAAAKRMTWLATTGNETAGMTRAEAFLRAGDQWLQGDDPGQAARWFRRALQDGGSVSADAKVALARALFQQGQDAAANQLIAEVQAEGPASPRICDAAAELLLERGDLTGALDFLTVGVRLSLEAGQEASQAAPDSELMLMLRLRYRIRNDLRLPRDDYDALLDESS